ncbi:sugar phosphate isomerase/epimerase family protein [Nonomuraea sp. SBT364]|uniref:sugar phosphate isomerase/epimerase family protein n=1 Tax=Nonomuraea sp. SBT364 TaxID=1580530 RepID=UPI00066DE9C3|nr:sugar phosphate isomerase/epimerase [Nonomuraea sp. SBT364]
MNTIAFMGANFVTRETGNRMPEPGWGEADRVTNERFAPLDGFAERFGRIVAEVGELGFTSMDVWTAHLNPAWATDRHLEIAAGLLAGHELSVPSLAGSAGADVEYFRGLCRIASAVGAPVIGGMAPVLRTDREAVVAALEEHDLKLGVENHPERTPEEYLEAMGDDAGGRIGAALDTGWFGTHGYDAADAIKELGDRIFHVHLKDVAAPGGHDTVALGDGCVPVRRCVEELRRIGYTGTISIEHEPEDRDPIPEVLTSRERLRQWLEA